MRSLAIIALLVGSSTCSELQKGGGNYVRVANGKVVEYDYASTLEAPQMRNGDGSTGDDNIFNGQISIVDALDPNSPFSQWIDDLLNEDSDPYKQAVVDALKILLAIMLAALAPLGITDFTILILGFSPGSVTVDYELAIDQTQWDDAAQPDDAILGAAISQEVTDNGDQIEGFSLNNQKTTISGGDGNTITSACPACWTVSAGNCVPDPAYLTLTCSSSGMELSVDYCVMGNTDISALTMNGGCDAGSSNIADNGTRYIATTPLDGCSTSMEFSNNQLVFQNYLLGGLDTSSVISTFDRNSVSFSCSYSTTYEDIDATTAVESSINSGDHDGSGQLGFQLHTYLDDTYQVEDTSGIVQIGATLNFGVGISQTIDGVVFSTTSCTVESDNGLSYGIMTANGCPNTRVNFAVANNLDSALNKFAYTVFEFRSEPGSNLHLKCNIVVCAAGVADSTCAEASAQSSCGNRKRRSIEEGISYHRISKTFTAI